MSEPSPTPPPQWRGWARPIGRRKWMLLATAATESECTALLRARVAQWRSTDRYVSATGVNPNRHTPIT